MKFRAKQGNSFIYAEIANDISSMFASYANGLCNEPKLFTGVYDMNGKEIYFGDVVKRTTLKNDWYPDDGHAMGHPKTKEWEEDEIEKINEPSGFRFGYAYETRTYTKEEVLRERFVCDGYNYIVLQCS